MTSQAQVIGRPPMRTWDDYEQGCLATFSGGYRGRDADTFRHGMSTVFNLLRSEFPEASVCKVSPRLLEALRDLAEWGRTHTSPLDSNTPHELLIKAMGALAEVDGTGG